MVMGVSWFGAALLLHDPDSLPSLVEPWILDCTSKLYRRMPGHLAVSWSFTESGSCSKPRIPNTQVNLQQNGWSRRDFVLRKGQVKVQTFTQFKCCGEPEASSSCWKVDKYLWFKAVLCGGMGQNSSKPMCRTNEELQVTFGSSYCCSRGYPQLLNVKVHILFPTKKMKVGSFFLNK